MTEPGEERDIRHWTKDERKYRTRADGSELDGLVYTHGPTGHRDYFVRRNGAWVQMLDYSRDGRMLHGGGHEFFDLIED